MLDARELGAGARLTAMGGAAVLVEGGDAAVRVVRIDVHRTMPMQLLHEVWVFPAGDLRGIDVADGYLSGSTQRSVFALACSDGPARCTLLRGETDATTLSRWEGADLPLDIAPRGIVVDDVDERQPVCVFGQGLFCFDGESWRVAISPEVGLALNHVAIGQQWSLAVGDDGRYFLRERADSGSLGEWIEQPSLGPVELTQASVSGKGGAIVGEGRVQIALGSARDTFACGTPDDLIALLVHTHAPRFAYAINATSEVLEHPPMARPGEYCLSQRLSMNDVQELGTAPCGIGINPRVRTEQTVIGMNFCPID